jgi:ATP-dependent DNA helicase RecQ
MEDLMGVSGISSHTAFTYGEEIIECIKNCEKEGKSRTKKSVEVIEYKGDDSKTDQASFNIFKEGYSVKDVADMRNISTKTVEDHIASVIKKGNRELPVTYFMSEREFDIITQCVMKLANTEKLRPLKELLETQGDKEKDISYFKLKVAIAYISPQKSVGEDNR